MCVALGCDIQYFFFLMHVHSVKSKLYHVLPWYVPHFSWCNSYVVLFWSINWAALGVINQRCYHKSHLKFPMFVGFIWFHPWFHHWFHHLSVIFAGYKDPQVPYGSIAYGELLIFPSFWNHQFCRVNDSTPIPTAQLPFFGRWGFRERPFRHAGSRRPRLCGLEGGSGLRGWLSRGRGAGRWQGRYLGADVTMWKMKEFSMPYPLVI